MFGFFIDGIRFEDWMSFGSIEEGELVLMDYWDFVWDDIDLSLVEVLEIV